MRGRPGKCHSSPKMGSISNDSPATVGRDARVKSTLFKTSFATCLVDWSLSSFENCSVERQIGSGECK